MSTAPRKRTTQSNDDLPQTPQTTPPSFSSANHDHSFTLQTVLELQKSVGEINANLQALKSSVDSTKAKVDDLIGWKHKIVGGAVVLGAVCTILGFAFSKASDYFTLKSTVQAPAAVK